MKVTIVEKECVAKTGIQVEFSNSECASIERVACNLNTAIEERIKTAKDFVKQGLQYDEKDDTLHVEINLKDAMRIQWLLDKFTRNSESGLFSTADNLFSQTIASINGKSQE